MHRIRRRPPGGPDRSRCARFRHRGDEYATVDERRVMPRISLILAEDAYIAHALMRQLSLILVLSGFWIAASGRFDPMLLGLMGASVVIVLLLARRLGVIDAEGHPTHLLGRAPRYWGWLISRVVVSNLAVVRLVFAPRAALSPSLVHAPISHTDSLGRTILANSATLTPGTVVCDLEGGEMIVHCLTPDAAAGIMCGRMDRRVTQMVRGDS